MIEIISAAIISFVGFAITSNVIHPLQTEEENQRIFLIGSVATTIIVLIFTASTLEESNIIFSLIGVLIVGAYFYSNESSLKNNKNNKTPNHYMNHCWNCNQDIDSDRDIKCSICGWYICGECKSCGCNYSKSR